MMEETKITISKDRYKAIKIHEKMILQHNPDIRNAQDKRKAFSDYVIERVIGHFVRDTEAMKGETEKKKDIAKELYLQYMQVWEENYGPDAKPEKEVKNDPENQTRNGTQEHA